MSHSGSEFPSLPRRPIGTPSDFEALREEGLEVIQRLCSGTWTDYNLHDPGITILEQFSYALTDLLYRLDLPVQDLLAGPGGGIDLEAQALHPPEAALPARPATTADVRAAILDAVPQVEDLWIDEIATEQGLPTGLLYARFLPAPGRSGSPEAKPEEVRSRILEAYAGVRTLGEDLHVEPDPVPRRRCTLHGTIVVSGDRPVEEILAELLASADQLVRGHEVAPTYAAMIHAGGPFEEIFGGPLLRSGAGRMRRAADRLYLADLVERARAVPGIEFVEDLELVEDPYTPHYGVLRLRVPEPKVEGLASGIDVRSQGRPVPVPAQFWDIYQARMAAYHRRLREKEDPALATPRPQGRHRGGHPYRTLQDHFPSVYGVGPRGLPTNASPEAKVGAAQLKAYLAPVEQLLADGIETLDQLSELFAVPPDPSGTERPIPTYPFRPLTDDHISGLERLYRRPDAAESILERMALEKDAGSRRRRRLLGHLLGVFGESEAPASSGVEGSPIDLDAAAYRSDARRVRSVVDLTRDRCGGVDYTAPLWPDPDPDKGTSDGPAVSGFQRRVGTLLGLPEPLGRPLAQGQGVESAEGFHVVEHILLRRGSRLGMPILAEPLRLRVSVLFAGWEKRCRHPPRRRQAEDILRSNAPAHVHVECAWLERGQMAEFESLYSAWWEAQRAEPWGSGAVDEAAGRVKRFLGGLQSAGPGMEER